MASDFSNASNGTYNISARVLGDEDDKVYTYPRTQDVLILIGCLGFCAILTMLVLGQKKKHRGYQDRGTWRESVTWRESLPQLPEFLRWAGSESELYEFERGQTTWRTVTCVNGDQEWWSVDLPFDFTRET